MLSSLLIYLLYLTNTSLCTIRLYQITRPIDHGEGPTWDERKGVLYFVDIHAGNVYSYERSSGKINYIHLDGEVSPVVPSSTDPDYLIVGLNRTVAGIHWDGKSKHYRIKYLTTVSKQFPTSRFNDGKADKQGRLWFGTMGFEDSKSVTPNQGLLYKITCEIPTVMIAPVNISNGLAWNAANDKFYYIDTPTRQIRQYDYDDEFGVIKSGRVVFDLANYPTIKGFPDGMTIDQDDKLWVALYNGGAVIQVDPRTGLLLQIVQIPADAVTSVAWGGRDYDILFITTSRYRLSQKQRREQPYAGSVFALTGLNSRGLKAFEADVV